MAINTLTEAICKNAKQKEKDYKLSDGHGMYLFVTAKGAKIWRMKYRLEGKEKLAVIGPYPLIQIKEARERRDVVRRQLLDGVDPQAKVVTQNRLTLNQVLELYLAHREEGGSLSGKYITNTRNGIQMHVCNYIGERHMDSITREDMLEVLMKLNKSGKFVYVKRIRMWCEQLFAWAQEHGHCKINPPALINPRVAFGSRPVKGFSHLPLREVPGFLKALRSERDQASVLACRMLALTWVRTGELREMKWGQIEDDVWRIPAENMKGDADSRREHLVPLSSQCLALLQDLKNRCRNSEYVFPADRDIEKPITENCVTDLMERMGYRGKMTGHGWRKVGSTWANEQVSEDETRKYDADWIEMQLAHIDGSVRGIYNSAEYMPQRRRMLQAYADWLDQANASTLEG